MARILRRRIFLVIALAAVLAGGTAAALGATHSARPQPTRHRGLHAHHAAKLPGVVAARHGHLHLREIVRSYLGLTRPQLRGELRAGKTLAQIADASPGHSAAGLREAIIAALRTRLDGKVAAHALSASAEQHRLGHLQPRVEKLLAHSHPGRHAHAHKGA